MSSDESIDDEEGSLRIVEDSIVSGKAAEDAASQGTMSEEENEGRLENSLGNLAHTQRYRH